MQMKNNHHNQTPILGSLGWTFGVLIVWVSLALWSSSWRQQDDSRHQHVQWIPYEKNFGDRN